MGLVESKRPVVLIVEDELLLRMNAVDMIEVAGFEVVEAANADEAIEILEARRDIGGYPDARLDGWIEARPGGERSLATDQDCRNLGPRRCGANGFTRRRAVSAETLQSGTGHGCATRVVGRGVIVHQPTARAARTTQ